MSVTILRPEPSHRTDWERLYAGYAAFYQTEQTDEMRERVWSWIQDPAAEVEALVAMQGDTLVGLAHFRQFARPLSATHGGFLDDLFVSPQARGGRVGEALIDAIAGIGRERGWSVIRWITADTNFRARSLYHRIAAQTPWITYDIRL